MNEDANKGRVYSVDLDETVYSPNPHHDKSVVLQLADAEFQTCDDNSQDLFNDNDSSAQNSPIVNFNESYRTTRADSTPKTDTASSLANTPKITNYWSVTRPTVPTIPMSLVPFISTVNESWNSELETPEAKTAVEYSETAGHERFSKSIGSADRKGGSSARSNGNGAVPEMKTPSGCFMVGMEDEELCVSPILNTTTNRRRRPKRRILKSLGDIIASSDSPEKNTDDTKSLSKETNRLGSEVEGEETLVESCRGNVNNATFVVEDNLTHIRDSNVQLLGVEGLRNDKKCQSKDEEPEKVTEVKKEWGFVTFTELCLQEEKRCENKDVEMDPSSPCKDVDLSMKENKNSFSFDQDEPLIDSDEFTPWFYQSGEQKMGSKEAHTTKKLTEDNQRLFKNEQIPSFVKEKSILTDENEQTTKCLVNPCSSIGFSTAGGKPIQISEEKLRNAEKVYNELSLQDGIPGKSLYHKIVGDKFKSNKENEATVRMNSHTSIGFSTAGGKPIRISEEKLRNAEKIYNELSLGDAIPGKSLNHKILGDKFESNSHTSIGFSTAGGIPIRISEEKLRNAEKVYNELSLQDGTPGKSSNHKILGDKFKSNKENEATIQRNYHTSIGFSTAGGVPIKISEEKLKNAEKIYNELSLADEKSSMLKKVGNNNTNNKNSLAISRVGGNPMSIRSNNATSSSNKAAGEEKVLKNSYNSIGFSTADGKAIKVSEDKLKAAQKLYRDINSTDELAVISAPRGIKRQRESHGTINSSGFKMASGKPLVISETAIKKARVMYDSVNIENTKKKDPKEVKSVSANRGPKKQSVSEVPESESDEFLLGFCRVSGKALMTKAGAKETNNSNHAMDKKSKSLTHEEKISLKNFNSVHRSMSSGFSSSSSVSAGFSTARGETIKISDQALSKAKDLLDDELQVPSVVEFTTANGKKIKISEDALLKAKIKLEIEQENTPPPRNSSEVTPVGSSIFPTSKRLGINSDFNLQARKLFVEEDSEADKNSVKAKTEVFGNDRLMTPKLEPQKCWPLKQDKDSMGFGAGFNDNDKARMDQTLTDKGIFTYSEEITASTAALLADEVNSLDGNSWGSEITCTSAAMQDRDISAKPITLGDEDVQEIPTSPIIGAKTRARKIRRSKKRSGLKVEGIQLKSNKDNETIQDQTSTEGSQRSSGATTPTSDSSKAMSPLLSPFRGPGPTRSETQFLDSRAGNLSEVTASEMDDDFSEARVAAILEQEKKIRIKKKHKPKPIVGSLLLRRTNNKDSRIPWREATNGRPPVPRNYHELTNLGIAEDAMEITAATALSYKFKCSDFYSKNEICSNPQGLDMGDGFRLIFDDNGYAGAPEFKRALLAGPGVDPDLVPERWVGNHYRWIVWKLASMDRMKFGDSMISRMLTPRHVMEQLKYRHDREIDKSERPALRRIIERDDPPCRRMVLCVATIAKLDDIQNSENSPNKSSVSHFKMELTDGWYSIPATIDSAMENLIAFGKVREGTKLITSRAELLNCDQGCSPLEIPGEASLKIHTNSTRRSRWDAKLGYCKYSSPISASLPSVLPNGGLIGKLNTVIARVYPNQYCEKHWSGKPIFRNNKCEDKAAMKYEEERQAQLEAIYSKAQADFEARNRGHSKTYSAAFSGSENPDSYQTCISDGAGKSSGIYDEAADTQAFQTELESILRQSLPPPRKVTLILKARLMGGENPAILTVWAPNEDTIDLIKEGNRVSVHNVQTSGKRSGDLQLTAGHQSFVKLEGSNVSSFPQRQFTPIAEVAVPGFNPPFGEFDTVGIVVSLGPAPHGMKNFEVVDLAYPPSSEAPGSPTYLSILFWEGIGNYGFSDILTVGSIVACNNIQWRRGAPRTVPFAYSTEHSNFTRNPRQNYLRSAFESVKKRITDCISFVSQSAVEIALERQKKSTTLRSPAVHGTPSKASPSTVFFTPGMSPQTPRCPPNTGKDCTPANYSIQRRLEKLNWYPEPPDLSPVTLKHGSNKCNHRFIPPVRTPEH